jgi:K+-sensing histidine kinase KdpD
MTAQELFNEQQRVYAQQLAQHQYAQQQAQHHHAQQQAQQAGYGTVQQPYGAPQAPHGYYQQDPQQTQAHAGQPQQAAPAAPQYAVPAVPQQAAPAAAPAAQAVPAEAAPVPAPAAAPAKAPADLVTGTLAGLAMRDLALVDSLIEVVEELEDSSEDPELLEKLFKIDNLATRMRRNGENLLVLAGQDSGDTSTEPVPLLDVARAAISEISEYQRVQLGRLPELFITGAAADDLSHLLAELMDNATDKSPEHAQVVVSAQAMSGDRLLITVEDEGIGIPAERLTSLNARLSGEPVLDETVMRHMGLYVVSRIAHRHGVQVQLEARAFRGISAHVIVPKDLFGSTGPRAAAPQPALRTAPPRVASGSSFSGGPAYRPAQPAPDASRQEKSSAMDSSVTAAGLPRRSAHRNTAPVPMLPTDGAPGTDDAAPAGGDASQDDDGLSRAERIRADLAGFEEGQREASGDE